MTAQGYRPNQMYEIVSPTGVVHTPSRGRCWSMVRERFDDLEAGGRIWWGAGGKAQPTVIRYLSEDEGLVPWTWWPHEEVGHSDEAKKEILALFPDSVFDTPKPERLLKRIIEISTNPGDIVLDCFLGSGTAAAVSHKLDRRWVGIELEGRSVETFVKPRLAKVIDGTDRGGISEISEEELKGDLPEDMDPKRAKDAASTLAALLDHGTFDGLKKAAGARARRPIGQALSLLAENPEARVELVQELAKLTRAAGKTKKNTTVLWDKGGGYRHLTVAESMFEDIGGAIVLADWATDGALAQAVAAQLRFSYQPQAPFAGKKGRQWLAVIDGMLTPSLVDYLLERTEDNETVVVVAQGLTPGVSDYLGAARKGSRARKVPRDLAHMSSRSERVNLELERSQMQARTEGQEITVEAQDAARDTAEKVPEPEPVQASVERGAEL